MVNVQDLRMLRYGSAEPLPERHELRAGSLTAVFEDGGLRYIRLGDKELIRGIYAAVRDRNWGTIKPAFRGGAIEQGADSFRIRFIAEHRQGEIDFGWEGAIDGNADGTITFSFDGTARSAFMKNRIGFCILHPADLAGVRAEVETPDGVIAGAFPARISPHQPFKDMLAIRHEAGGGLTAELRFEGELFEMEDQRNWTDASFKTYCTPLSLPFPVEIEPGQQVRQRVTLRLTGEPSPLTSGIGAAGDGDASLLSKPHIAVGARSIGRVPQIGLGHRPGRSLETLEAEKLGELRPAFLRATIRLSDPSWATELETAAHNAQRLASGLELEALFHDGADAGESYSRQAERLVEAIAECRHPLDAVYPYLASEYVSNGELLSLVIRLRDNAGLSFRVGGGSRAYFAEFGRAALPLEAMEAAAFTINPQVHAFDAASLAEAASAQGEAVRSAQAIAPGLPVAVGPVTFKPRLNPSATSPEALLASEDRAKHEDARQWSLFGAGWTLGSLKSLAESGADRVCYYETTGPLGVMPEGGADAYPLFHVLAAVGAYQGAELLECIVKEPLSYEAMAMRSEDGRAALLIANYTDAVVRVRVRAPAFRPARLRQLDERGCIPQRDRADGSGGFPVPAAAAVPVIQDGCFELELLPFAVAFVER
ncbi:hypothetical protein GZH47_23670 [Paenibacillus rhizovicinus]|uniref:Uncharacterized protein n=1 Tax=Paenibacillus rhizovicinus TaxID=2704463 RepID=A0A6C0P4T1_9BACL|nr:hypothetical protein [Paenibacillus rhizovicinus]QHW33499.1 hypothetical protein GZH47_23670 [Paenibacillus rhizovicinus]